VVHGNAVGLMLPQVVRFNAELPAVRAQYAELTLAAGLADKSDSGELAVDLLVNCLSGLLRLTQLPRTAEALGVRRDAIPHLAREASKQWTAGFNPRPIGEGDFARLYESALGLTP
jgi:alcohol dehydrogenase